MCCSTQKNLAILTSISIATFGTKNVHSAESLSGSFHMGIHKLTKALPQEKCPKKVDF